MSMLIFSHLYLMFLIYRLYFVKHCICLYYLFRNFSNVARKFALCHAKETGAVVPEATKQSPHKRFVAVCRAKLKAVETNQRVSAAFTLVAVFLAYLELISVSFERRPRLSPAAKTLDGLICFLCFSDTAGRYRRRTLSAIGLSC